MNWKKLNLDNASNPVLFVCQNSSILPKSKVLISVTTTNVADEANAFLLTGPNQLRLVIPIQTNVFYVEDDGGIFTHASGPIEKLVNYNIPTSHVDCKATNQVIEIPEGAYFVIQNKSEDPLRFGVDGQGVFVLTQHQMLSFTFTKASRIRLAGSGQDCSYLISESSNVTKLSDEMQTRINEMDAGLKLLQKTAATQQQLQEIEKKTWFGRWSESVLHGIGQSNQYESPVFGPNKDIHSDWMKSKDDILDVVQEIDLTWKDGSHTHQEHAVVKYTLYTKEEGHDHPMAEFYSDNKWIMMWIQKIDLIQDTEQRLLKTILHFGKSFESMNVRTKVRADNTAFKQESILTIRPQKNASFTVKKMNADLFFGTQEHERHILNQWAFPGTKEIISITEWQKKKSEDTTWKKIEFFSSANKKAEFSFQKDHSKATLVITLPGTENVDQIIGLNLRPNRNVDKAGVYLDLITLGDSKSVKSFQDFNHIFTIPLYRHSVTRFDHLLQVLDLSDETIQTKYNFVLELVVKKTT